MKLPSRYRKFSSVWKFINMDKHSQYGASFGHELVVEKLLHSYFIDFIPWYKYVLKKSVESSHPFSSQIINFLQIKRPKRLLTLTSYY